MFRPALRQESIALEQSRDNVREWRTSFDRRFDEVVRELLGRALMIGVFLFLLALGSEIWRRATFRYVSDLRRRRQFLIMRRFTTGILMSIVVILGLVSNFGSLASAIAKTVMNGAANSVPARTGFAVNAAMARSSGTNRSVTRKS